MPESSQPDYTSRVPRYTFAETLPDQQSELSTNPLMERFRQARNGRAAADPFLPRYHFINPEGSLNDPNGLCFWLGHWHLFYQAFPPDDWRPHWGHAISTDLIHWQDLPYAIYPHPEEASWSGSTIVDGDRVIAMYFGLNAGNMVAVSTDPLLLNWEKVTGQAVIPAPCPIWQRVTSPQLPAGVSGQPVPMGAINFVYDPCIWKKDGVYYSLSGGTLPHMPSGKRMRTFFLFRSNDLKSWEYLHPFVDADIFGLPGDDGACPYFWPIGNRHILLHFSHRTGSKYILGDYDAQRDKFVATAGESFTFGPWLPGAIHAPTGAPDGKGGVIAMFNINAGNTASWSPIMSMARRLTLVDGNELAMEPAGDIASLRGLHQHVPAMPLPANQEIVLDGIQGNAMEITAEIDVRNASMIEMDILRSPGKEECTRILFFKQRGFRNWERYDGFDDRIVQDTSDSWISVDTSASSQLPDVLLRAPETAPVYVKAGETLKLRVFIDVSVMEVFVNDRQCVTLRVYPGRPDSRGVSLLARGHDAALMKLDAWQMKSIYST